MTLKQRVQNYITNNWLGYTYYNKKMINDFTKQDGLSWTDFDFYCGAGWYDEDCNYYSSKELKEKYNI